MASPIIAIIHGACQPAPLYVPFTKALDAHSLPSYIISLPSCDASPSHKDFSADVTLIRDTVTKSLDDGKNVIVVMHSYGGIPGSAALKGLGKTERSKAGKETAVLRLVYVCSQLLREGERMPGAGDVESLKKHVGDGFDEDVCSPCSRSPQILAFSIMLICHRL